MTVEFRYRIKRVSEAYSDSLFSCTGKFLELAKILDNSQLDYLKKYIVSL